MQTFASAPVRNYIGRYPLKDGELVLQDSLGERRDTPRPGPTSALGAPSDVLFTATGQWRGQPVQATGRGASVLGLRDENRTTEARGRGVYDDRIVVLWKDAQGHGPAHAAPVVADPDEPDPPNQAKGAGNTRLGITNDLHGGGPHWGEPPT
mgnify:CR=1 FL=1